MNATIIKAIGYVRVSTEEQAREGVSIEAQEERIRALATAKVRIPRESGRVFRRKAATIPSEAGHPFRRESGHF